MDGPKYDGFCLKFYKTSVLTASKELLDRENEAIRQAEKERRAKAANAEKRDKANRLSRTLKVLADSEAETQAERVAAKKRAEKEKRDAEDAVSPDLVAKR